MQAVRSFCCNYSNENNNYNNNDQYLHATVQFPKHLHAPPTLSLIVCLWVLNKISLCNFYWNIHYIQLSVSWGQWLCLVFYERTTHISPLEVNVLKLIAKWLRASSGRFAGFYDERAIKTVKETNDTIRENSGKICGKWAKVRGLDTGRPGREDSRNPPWKD